MTNSPNSANSGGIGGENGGRGGGGLLVDGQGPPTKSHLPTLTTKSTTLRSDF